HTAPEGKQRQSYTRSGCAPLVPVVKATNLQYGNDGSEFPRLHRPCLWCALANEVRPGFVIIGHECFQVAIQTRLTKNDHVVEVLAANRADDALHVGSLPR